MQNTLRHHILFLEHRLQGLRDQLTSPLPINIGCERLESEIRVVQRALGHYQQAFDLEQLIVSSSHPNISPGTVPRTR
jgi:hypothetical protein